VAVDGGWGFSPGSIRSPHAGASRRDAQQEATMAMKKKATSRAKKKAPAKKKAAKKKK
jgi:hypothetical protein